ncbi:hypothetical protein PAMP_005455 [Pampus punctatissimus]
MRRREDEQDEEESNSDALIPVDLVQRKFEVRYPNRQNRVWVFHRSGLTGRTHEDLDSEHHLDKISTDHKLMISGYRKKRRRKTL